MTSETEMAPPGHNVTGSTTDRLHALADLREDATPACLCGCALPPLPRPTFRGHPICDRCHDIVAKELAACRRHA